MHNYRTKLLLCCITLNIPLIVAQNQVSMELNTVVIPSAGYGTRLLPCTKSVPKELLPLLNKKPAAQEIVEECLKAGFNHCLFVVSENKTAIKDYFAHNEKLENNLKKVGKLHLLDGINEIIDTTSFSYVEQSEMKGLGHAVLMAKPYIQNQEYFGVILPDMIFFETYSVMQQIALIAKKYQACVIAVQKVAPEEIHAYGTIKIGSRITEKLFEVIGLVEKPKAPALAPSLYAIMGRYIFSSSIFEAIEQIAPYAQGEIQLTDAIEYLVKKGERVLAYDVDGKLFDIGQPQGWFAANMYLGQVSNVKR